MMLTLIAVSFAYTEVSAQIPNISDKEGCIWQRSLPNVSHCVGCGQEFEDGSGFCQDPNPGCPDCWHIVENGFNETHQAMSYQLTIDPNGTPTVIIVINITLSVESYGWKLVYTEI